MLIKRSWHSFLNLFLRFSINMIKEIIIVMVYYLYAKPFKFVV